MTTNTYHDPKNAIGTSHECIACASVLRGEHFGRERIQHAVHDVAREGVAAIPPQESVRRTCSDRCEDEHSGEDCHGKALIVSTPSVQQSRGEDVTGGDAECPASTEVGQLNKPPSQKSTGDTHDAQDDLLQDGKYLANVHMRSTVD